LREYGLTKQIAGNHVLLVGGSRVEGTLFKKAKYVERMTGKNPNHGSVHLDLADMHILLNESFDLVFACHVLEHVQKLSAGLKEVHRVLKPGRSAVFCVPIARRKKSKFLGRADRQGHWYAVGRDWSDAYEAAGFSVHESLGSDYPAEYGIKAENKISICTRSH
jgi:SAM-dependent methyltransferase